MSTVSKWFQPQAYSQPGWQPTKQHCWPVPPLSPLYRQREHRFWGEAQEMLPHPSHQLPPPHEFNWGGAETAWRRRQLIFVTLRAAGRLFPASLGQGEGWKVGPCPLSAVSHQLPPRGDCTRSLAWRCDQFCTPIAHEGTSQFTAKTSEHFATVLA